MKAVLRLIFLIGFIGVATLGQAQKIEWMSFEDAVAASEKEPRKLLIDIYTNWCGWCKKMDREAYTNEVIVSYINETFYPVKFNAEQKGDIEFDGHTFKFVASGRRGVHELAAALTNNKLSYPTTVFMDEQFKIIQPIPGYMTAQSMDPILKYIGGDKFKSVDWQAFQQDYESSL